MIKSKKHRSWATACSVSRQELHGNSNLSRTFEGLLLWMLC